MHRKKWLKYVQEECKQFNTPKVIQSIWETICKEEFVLTYSGGLEIRAWVKRLWGFDETRSFMGINSGGAGLGYGLGASIGAALHYKNSDKLCINLQSDGDMLFTPSALWTAAHYQVPLLIIVMNNRSYAITKKISDRVAKKRGRSTDQIDIGTTLTNPEVDFVQLAKSFGISTFPTINNLEELVEILPKAIKMVKSTRKPVLIDLIYEN
ncbi:MAG: putative thiamine pyrophosphate enzyme [Burkholderiales bacterium]|nr:putative thiamine pyrophosphate enzyme [Burkholderiales bacterium]